MPVDARVQRFLSALRASNPPPTPDAGDTARPDVLRRRSDLAELMRFGGPAAPVAEIVDRDVAGPGGALMLRLYTPLDLGPDPCPGLVYFHGGGFVAGSVATHEGIARGLAGLSACRVVSVEYRLAPEHPFPAALDDALAAVRHVRARAPAFGIDVARLGVCGDSAGGTLAATVCQTLAQEGDPPLALQVLLCPILDYGGTSASKRDLASGYLLEQETLDQDLRHYLPPGVEPCDPRISPLRAADLAGLPRTLIHTAEFDPLRDEGQSYFDRLTRAGCTVAYTCHPGMIHLFYGLGGVIPYARSAMEQIGREIKAAFA